MNDISKQLEKALKDNFSLKETIEIEIPDFEIQLKAIMNKLEKIERQMNLNSIYESTQNNLLALYNDRNKDGGRV